MTYRSASVTVALLLVAVPATAQGERLGSMGPVASKESLAREHAAARLVSPMRGDFNGTEGHRAHGSYEIGSIGGRLQLRLGSNFSVEEGTDVQLVLSRVPRMAAGALPLGRLARFAGAQSFDLPAGTDLSTYSYVVLWSSKQSAAMGVALLPLVVP